MKSILTIFFTLITLFVIAQTDSTLIKQVQKLRKDENYSQIINLLKQEHKNKHSDLWLNYQLACYYSLSNDTINSFIFLQKAIILGADGKDILTDTDFENIHSCVEWTKTVKQLEQIYIDQYPDITNKKIAIELWHMYIEDQRYRTLGKNYKKVFPDFGTIEYKDLNDSHSKITATNKKRLHKLIKQSGWPKYSEVGITGGDAVFYIYQHSTPKEMRKMLHLMIEAGKHGDADLGKAAMMIDRILAFSDNIQIYGSQAHGKRGKDQSFDEIEFELYPIADEENMISRRESLGMPDFYENCKRLKVNYIPIEKREGYKKVPLKKKWIKKGYLLVN